MWSPVCFTARVAQESDDGPCSGRRCRDDESHRLSLVQQYGECICCAHEESRAALYFAKARRNITPAVRINSSLIETLVDARTAPREMPLAPCHPT